MGPSQVGCGHGLWWAMEPWSCGNGVGGLGLEFPPCGPLQVTGLCHYMKAGFQERRNISCQNFLMPELRIPGMSFPSYYIGQSRNRLSSDSRGGRLSSNSWSQEWHECTKRWSYLRPRWKNSYHYPPYGHSNTFPSCMKHTLFPPLRMSEWFIPSYIIS